MTDANNQPVVPAETPAELATVANLDAQNTPTTDNVVQKVAQADSTPATGDTPVSAESLPTVEDVTPQRSRAQERIEDLVAERNAAKEYAEYWRQEALKIREHASQATQQAPQAPPAPKDESAPTLDQFAYDQTKWSKALTDWSTRQIQKQVAQMVPQVVEQRTNQEVHQQAIEAFNEKIEKFKESHSDFDIVTSNPRLPAIDKTASAMVVASEHAAELVYALAKNPDLTTRISRMRPAEQALAIGRLESQIQGNSEVAQPSKPTPRPNPAPAAKPSVGTTQAPPPPSPVPAGGASEVSPGNTDVKTWMKIRNSEDRSRRRR